MSYISYDWTKPDRKLNIIYRLCDKKINTNFETVTKQQCLNNFIRIFGNDNVTILADNCSDEIDQLAKFGFKVIKTNLGNSLSLKYAFELGMTYNDDDIVYFVEDDHLHLKEAPLLIREGIERADYVSLYFHPDKLHPGPNPYISALGEKCHVFRTDNSIWKTTNSTVQTFACKVKTLKEDKEILWKHNFNKSTPDSFNTFIDLGKKGKTLIHPIPGRSTHCHSPWISPFIDWVKVANGYDYLEHYVKWHDHGE